MTNKLLVVGGSVIAVLLIAVVVFLSGWTSFEQSYVTLRVSRIGSEEARQGQIMTNTGTPVSAEVITGGRRYTLFEKKSWVQYYFFEKGTISYLFSSQETLEGEGGQSITASTIDGTLGYSLLVHFELLDTLPTGELATRLYRLLQDENIKAFAGQEELLYHFAETRLPTIIQTFASEYAGGGKRILEYVQGKKDHNAYLTKRLNDYYNPKGIRFTLVGIVQNVNLDQGTRQKLDEIAKIEIDRQALAFKSQFIRPLDSILQAKTTALEQEYVKVTQGGISEASQIKANADAYKVAKLTRLLGQANYARYRQSEQFVSAVHSSQNGITLVPRQWIPIGGFTQQKQ